MITCSKKHEQWLNENMNNVPPSLHNVARSNGFKYGSVLLCSRFGHIMYVQSCNFDFDLISFFCCFEQRNIHLLVVLIFCSWISAKLRYANGMRVWATDYRCLSIAWGRRILRIQWKWIIIKDRCIRRVIESSAET